MKTLLLLPIFEWKCMLIYCESGNEETQRDKAADKSQQWLFLRFSLYFCNKFFYASVDLMGSWWIFLGIPSISLLFISSLNDATDNEIYMEDSI